MNLKLYNSPEYQKKMQECIDQYKLIDELEAEVARLRALIDRHRSRVWALHKVSHPEDVELYDAAGLGEG